MVFTQQQENVLIGSLLGDGHLERSKPTHNTSLKIKRAKTDLDYLKWQFDILKDHCAMKTIHESSVLDSRTNKTYDSVYFRTKRLKELNHFHDKWYLNKIKIIPSLKLNSEIMAIWFADDGHIKKKFNNYEISFATNSFSKHEVEYLIKLLTKRYEEKFYLCKQTKNKKVRSYYIVASSRASQLIIDDIDPFLPLARKKIWKKEKQL